MEPQFVDVHLLSGGGNGEPEGAQLVGYQIHVSKPVEPDRLVNVIAEVVARPA